MKLLTKKIETKLRKNGNPENRDQNHIPVVKFFTPDAGATWLISEMDEDGDTMFGLCDLGSGYPELGYVSFRELQSIRGHYNLPVERDKYFKGQHPMSVYVDNAREEGRISV